MRIGRSDLDQTILHGVCDAQMSADRATQPNSGLSREDAFALRTTATSIFHFAVDTLTCQRDGKYTRHEVADALRAAVNKLREKREHAADRARTERMGVSK